MSNNLKLVHLKNIGEVLAGRLHEIGIHDDNELRIVGASKAYKMLKDIYPNEVLPVCYYLYSFEGALQDCDWRKISEDRKRVLKEEI